MLGSFNPFKHNSQPNKIFKLLNLAPCSDEDKDRLDGNAVMIAVQRNPRSTTIKYQFNSCSSTRYPLHQAVTLGANVDVMQAIYNSFPEAIQEKYNGFTVLNLSIESRAPPEVTIFLLSKWPEAVRNIDKHGGTPLHLACHYNAPYEVLLSLLNIWPDAVREENRFGDTPLHCALSKNDFPTLESLLLLIAYYPGALRVKNCFELTPLRCAAGRADVPMNFILLLLEKWPHAIVEEDRRGRTPYDVYRFQRTDYGAYSLEILDVLSVVHHLYSNNNLNNDELKEVMNFFIQMEWWNGVALLLDKHPDFLKYLNVDDFKMFPRLFSIIGRRCTMKTMWNVVCNEVYIIEGV
uniref:Uncharacterized protein n=1 Tax=Helicotheca tamesis TaxID=374047 RepID=A0A7S2E0Q7_9STRA